MHGFSIKNFLSYVYGPSIDQIIEREPGLTIELVNSRILSAEGYHIVQARKIFADGSECAGLGVDKKYTNALVKAIAEYFERKAVISVGESFGFRSTNGVAAHRFSYLAKHSAYFELAERDAFLAHWYSQSPFSKLEEFPIVLSNFKSLLDSRNLKTFFFVTTLGFEVTTVCFIVNKYTGGFAIGLSAGRGRADSVKAFQEAVINFDLGGYTFSQADLEHHFDVEGLTSLQAHRTYWLYKSILPEWVLRGGQCKKWKPPVVWSKTKFVQLSKEPFLVFGAMNDSFVNLSVGLPTKNDLIELTRRVEFDIHAHGEWLIHPIP